MQIQDYTTDPTLVTVLNWCAPSDVNSETGLGTYYLGDSIVIARPLWADPEDAMAPGEWYIESVEGY